MALGLPLAQPDRPLPQDPPAMPTGPEGAPEQGARAPAGEDEILSDIANFQPNQMAPAAPPAQNDAHILEDISSFTPEGTEKQGPPAPTEGLAGHYGVVQRPDGTYGVLEDGKVRDLTPREKEASHYMGRALRIGGPVIGNILGAAGGSLIGPAGAYVGGVVGAPIGGQTIDTNAQQYEKIAGEKPGTHGIKESALEAGGAVLGPIIGKSFMGSGLVRDAGQAGVEAAEQASGATLAKEGAKALSERRATDTATIGRSDLPAVPEGTVKTTKFEAGLEKSISDSFEKNRGNFQGNTDAGADFIQNYRSNMGKKIGAFADKASEVMRQKQTDATEFDGAFRAILDKKNMLGPDGKLIPDSQIAPAEIPLARAYRRFLSETTGEAAPEGFGKTGNQVPINSPYAGPGSGVEFPNPQYNLEGAKVTGTGPETPLTQQLQIGTKYPQPTTPNNASYNAPTPRASESAATTNMPPNAAGKITRGMTLSSQGKWLDSLADEANFSSASRTPTERSFGKLYDAMRTFRDSNLANELESAGKPELAQSLRGLRDKFSNSVDLMDQLGEKIAKNPSQAFSQIVQKGNPSRIIQLGQELPPEQFRGLGDQFLEEVKGALDNGGPKAANKALDKYSPEVAKALLGPEYKSFKTLFNAGEAIERRLVDPTSLSDTASAAIGQIKHLVTSPYYFMAGHGAKMIDAMRLGKYIPQETGNINPLVSSAAGAGFSAATNQPNTLGSVLKSKERFK